MFYRKNPFSQPFFWLVVLCAAMVLGSCTYPGSPSVTPTTTSTNTATPSPIPTDTPTPTATQTSTNTPAPTATTTAAPTTTNTPTISPTPTAEVPSAIVNVGQAFCRYGPGTAYLYSHGLYEGDHVTIDGRNYNGTWLWVQPHNLARHCWSAASRFRMMQAAHNLPAVCCTL